MNRNMLEYIIGVPFIFLSIFGINLILFFLNFKVTTIIALLIGLFVVSSWLLLKKRNS